MGIGTLIAEVPPGTDLEKLLSLVESVRDYADAVTLPDAPLAKPMISTIVAATVLRVRLDYNVIPHIRVADYNAMALRQAVLGLNSIGVSAALFTRGDPAPSTPLCYPSAEEALKALFASIGGFDIEFSVGALISLRKPLSLIERRLNEPFSFYYILRASRDTLDKLAKVYWLARSRGKRVYAYVIVANRQRIASARALLSNQPVIALDELTDIMNHLRNSVDGFVVSAPLSKSDLKEALKLARRLI